MEHDAHLADNVDQAGSGAKIIAALGILAAIAAFAVYVVYFSGLWS